MTGPAAGRHALATALTLVLLAGCKPDSAAPRSDGGGSGSGGGASAGAPAPITGRDFADRLSGTEGEDTILALGGADEAIGGPGNDHIDGGSGDDLLIGDGDLPATDDPAAPALPNPAPPGPDFHPEGRGWSLVWSDEFDGEALDPEKWAPEVSCWGGGNDERQCYTARPENVQVVNGLLRLVAREEEYTGPSFPPEWQQPDPQNTQPYTSGKVRTRGLADWRYGRFEVRAKLPAGQGTWPAVWMMPAEDFYGTWPLSGEIDIMEAVNLGALCTVCTGDVGENRTSAAIHFGNPWPDNRFIDQKTELPDGANPADDYHVWAAEWGEGVIQFFLDGERYLILRNYDWFTSAPNAAGNDNAPFDRAFYIMANLAIGGAFPELNNALGIDPGSLPNEFLIDWVRIYQCEEDPDTGRACMQEG